MPCKKICHPHFTQGDLKLSEKWHKIWMRLINITILQLHCNKDECCSEQWFSSKFLFKLSDNLKNDQSTEFNHYASCHWIIIQNNKDALIFLETELHFSLHISSPYITFITLYWPHTLGLGIQLRISVFSLFQTTFQCINYNVYVHVGALFISLCCFAVDPMCQVGFNQVRSEVHVNSILPQGSTLRASDCLAEIKRLSGQMDFMTYSTCPIGQVIITRIVQFHNLTKIFQNEKFSHEYGEVWTGKIFYLNRYFFSQPVNISGNRTWQCP